MEKLQHVDIIDTKAVKDRREVLIAVEWISVHSRVFGQKLRKNQGFGGQHRDEDEISVFLHNVLHLV